MWQEAQKHSLVISKERVKEIPCLNLLRQHKSKHKVQPVNINIKHKLNVAIVL